MELPKTDLENLATVSFLLIHNDTLYKMGELLKEEDRLSGADFIKIDNVFYRLGKRDTIKALEEMWKTDFSKELMEYQNFLLKTGKFETLSTVEIEKEKTEIKLLDFIVNNVFSKFMFMRDTPFLANRNEETGVLNESVFKQDTKEASLKSMIKQDLGAEASTGDEIFDYIRNYKNRQQNVENKQNPKEAKSSILFQIIQQELENVERIEQEKIKQELAKQGLGYQEIQEKVKQARINKEIIFFTSIPQYLWSTREGNGTENQCARINGELIGIVKPVIPFWNLINEYKKQLKHVVEVEALQNMPLQERVMQIKAKIEEVLTSSEYKVMGLDLYRNSNDSYFIYLGVPEFIMQNEDKTYYKFPKATIMMRIFMQKGEIRCNPPQIREKYKHPFLSSFEENQCICTNSYNPREANPNIDMAEEIYRKLDNARQVIMSGLFSGVKPYGRGLDDDRFNEYRISKSEAEKLNAEGKVKITNWWK